MYLEIADLTKTLKGRVVLDHVNASFERGMVYGIVGPNGIWKDHAIAGDLWLYKAGFV